MATTPITPLTFPTARLEDDKVLRLITAHREKGDRRALERIFAMHDHLLRHVVGRYAHTSGELYEDLLQVGYVGLIKAVGNFEIGKNAKFSSYAYSIIDGELRHHFRDTGMVKKPRWARSLYAAISESTARLANELGRPPLIEELAREVNVTPEGVVEVMKLYLDTNVHSLDASVSSDSGGSHSEYGASGATGADLSAIRSLHHESFALPIEDRILLEQGLELLTELQKKVVYLFFYKDLSQTEIGEMLGLPQRKVSRIVADSVKALRNKVTDRH